LEFDREFRFVVRRSARFDTTSRAVTIGFRRTVGGVAATATHVGPIDEIGETHDAVVAWCVSDSLHLSRVRWEVYGDPDASGQFAVDVYWSVLASA
jgi:hypothetical protein